MGPRGRAAAPSGLPRGEDFSCAPRKVRARRGYSLSVRVHQESLRRQPSDRCGSAAKLNPHRPGIAPALGLRAGADNPLILSQTALAGEPRSEASRRTGGRIMSLLNLLSRIRRRSAKRRRKTAAFRPRIEALEDRTLLSIAWVADMPGEWSDPTNWIDDLGNHRVPGPGDDVALPASLGTYTVSAPSACRSLSFDDPAALSISSILGVYGPATLNGAVNITGRLEARGGDGSTIDGAVGRCGKV